MLASGAEAHGFGMHHCGGFGVPIFNSYSSDSGYYSHRTHDYSYRRPVKEEKHVARRVSETKVAKADTDEHPRADSENSSIAVSGSNVADAKTTAAPLKTATAESTNVGCKEFFPSVGMTLSVPCQ
jgi:hypothetical protein